MTYSSATDSYQADFLENILGTVYKYGVPYIINREKYEAVMRRFNKEVRIKDANVVVFHAEYNKDEEDYSYAFFAWPKNSPEGSEDFYDCSQFWDYKPKERFEEFVHAILGSVVGVDKLRILALIEEENAERCKIDCEIEVLKQLLYMTQEEKELLLKDLCTRIPYGLFCQTDDGKGKLISVECSTGEDLVYVDFGHPQAEEYDLNEGDVVKPYLRPMLSMTEEEKKEYNDIVKNTIDFYDCPKSEDVCFFIIPIEWLNAHHFDYRGLIEKGLALEAPEGMYKTE